MQTTFDPEYRAIPRASTTRLTFSAHLFAPEVKAEGGERSLVSLSSVLDKSGSMGGSKLDLVKRTSDFMMQHLSSQDKLGVVTYDSDVQELIKLSRTSDAFKKEAKRVVKGVRAGSCTNLSGGLFLGVKQQQDNTYVDWGDDGAPPPPGQPAAAAGGEASPTHSASAASNATSDSFCMVPAEANACSGDEDSGEDNEEEEQQQVQMATAHLMSNVMPTQNFALPNVGCEEEEEEKGPAQQTVNIPTAVPIQQQQAAVPMEQQLPFPIQQPFPVQQQQQQQQQRPKRVPGGLMSWLNNMVPGKSRRMQRRGDPAAGGRGGAGQARAGVFGGRPAPAGKAVEETAVRSVFLFTDGLANEGVTESGRLVAMLRKMLDRSPRVRVFTFGFGSDHSPSMLSALAEAGSGTYYYIENEEKIPTAFADALGGLLSVAVQNVSVEFAPGPGVTVSEVHTSFATAPAPGGGRAVTVGDLFSEESKDILFDVELPALPAPADRFLVGTLKVSFLDVASASNRTEEVACYVARPDEVAAADAEPSMGVTLQRARVATARTLLEAREEADADRFDAARARIGGSLGWLREVQSRAEGAGEGGEMARNFVEDLEEALSNMEDRGTYRSHGTKVMSGKGMGHMQQRSCALEQDDFDEVDDGGVEEEAGCKQAARRSKFSYANQNQRAMRKSAKTWFSPGSA